MTRTAPTTTDPAGDRAVEAVLEDLNLDESGRNAVQRQLAAAPQRSLRTMAADAATTWAIGQAYAAQ